VFRAHQHEVEKPRYARMCVSAISLGEVGIRASIEIKAAGESPPVLFQSTPSAARQQVVAGKLTFVLTVAP
jgi:hypothetical protein